MTLDDAFPLTPDDLRRLTLTPFPNTPEMWELIARPIPEQLAKAYATGEIQLERALKIMRACSIGCSLSVRITLMAYTVERLLSIQPPRWKGRHPTTPLWIMSAAASLVEVLREQRPDEAFAPNELNDWKPAILEDAIDWLVAVGLCEERITARTLYDWIKKSKQATRSNSGSTA